MQKSWNSWNLNLAKIVWLRGILVEVYLTFVCLFVCLLLFIKNNVCQYFLLILFISFGLCKKGSATVINMFYFIPESYKETLVWKVCAFFCLCYSFIYGMLFYFIFVIMLFPALGKSKKNFPGKQSSSKNITNNTLRLNFTLKWWKMSDLNHVSVKCGTSSYKKDINF